MPECIHPEQDGTPCLLADLQLWPENLPAWEAYARVGNMVREALLGFPPLDWPCVITVLEKTGHSPGSPDGWDELLTALQIIHRARAEAQKPEESNGGTA